MLKNLLSAAAALILPAVSFASAAPAAEGLFHAANSRNWAGYVAAGGSFTGVSGTWTVPAGSGNGAAATWVGIGGSKSEDLIQAGTEEAAGRNGAVEHDAWIEMLPAVSQPVNLAVKAGDSVTVSLNQVSAGQWQITIKNNTSGQQYQSTQQYASSLSSAEWIEEAPSSRRGELPLDNFGSVAFSGASTVENGATVSVAQAGGQAITMVSANRTLATPSTLGADGASFSVAYNGGATTSPAPNPVATEPFPVIPPGFGPRPYGRIPFARPFSRRFRDWDD
jgi:hypothetical protein